MALFAGEHSWLLSEPDPGLEISSSHSGCQTHRTLLQSALPGQCVVMSCHVNVKKLAVFAKTSGKFMNYIFSYFLYQAMSPDGEAIVTGAGDETLRFWNVFSKTRSTKVGEHFVGTVFCN